MAIDPSQSPVDRTERNSQKVVFAWSCKPPGIRALRPLKDDVEKRGEVADAWFRYHTSTSKLRFYVVFKDMVQDFADEQLQRLEQDIADQIHCSCLANTRLNRGDVAPVYQINSVNRGSFLYTEIMKLLFAQGNPGAEYERTRHNVGFVVLDKLARAHTVTFQPKDKFKALIAELSLDGEKVLLAKPQTFYNETGLSARAIVDFYKLDPSADVLVIHDELALPFGTLRTRPQGSDAGNNGIKSLNQHLGANYHRLRIGIRNELRDRAQDVDFVLGRFNGEEQEALENNVVPKSIEILDSFVAGNFEHTSHTL